LYALGVILYELFTGQRPFAGSDQEVLEQHRRSKPASPRKLNPALSVTVEHLILKLLDKDPNRRYAHARQTRRILASMTAVTSGQAQPAAFVPPQRRPLIGREDILPQLLSFWRETEQGQGRFLLITGRAGSGKTRLLQEFAQEIKRATLLIGNCQKRAGGPAFQPIIGAVTDCLMNSVRLGQASAATDTPIGRLLNRVAAAFPEVESFYSSRRDFDQEEAFSTGREQQPAKPATPVEALREMTTDRPCLLIMDDLHQCDHSSLKLLRYLANHYSGLRLMIVGTYQDDGIEENQLLAELLDLLDRQPTYRQFRLRPFTEDGTAKFLSNIWLQPAPADLSAAIYRRTKGNPLYIEEIAKLLTDEGVVSWRGRQWHFEPVVEASLPRHVRETVLRRTERLPRRTQTILNQAAILGSTFTFTDLLAFSQTSSLDLLESLDVLLERQLIRQAAGEKRLHFSHTEFQQALYGQMTALKRGSLHREAGEALEQSYDTRLDDVIEELAHHFFQAGELKKAFTYSIQAARRAETLYAHHTALAWYTPALDALEQLGMNDETEQQRFEVLLARERINDELGHRPAQSADLALLEKLADSAAEPAKQALVHNRQAAYNCAAAHLDQAIAAAEAGLVAAQQAGAPRLESDSLLRLACIASSRGQFDQAGDYLNRALDILTAADSPAGQSRVMVERALIARYANNYVEAEDLCRQALTINRAINNRSGQADALNLLGVLHLDQGDFGQALICFQQSLETNGMIGRRQAEADCLSHLAAIYKKLGRLELADDHIKAALAIRYSIEDQLGKAKDRVVLGTIYVAREDYVAGRDYAGEALELFQRLGLRPLESNAWLELGLAQESLGDLAKAEAAYSQARTIYQALGNIAGVLDSRAGLARCLLAGGKTGGAQNEIEICLAELKARGSTGLKHPVRLYLTAYWVLQAANRKENAIAVLREGWKLLKARADTITQADLRTSFLNQVSENKEFLIQLQQYDEDQ
jgi:predicted ATPase